MIPNKVKIPPAERIKSDVQHLKDWILKEPQLPNIDDDVWLETFLFNNKFRLEKTKAKLNNYYALRSKHPQLLKNRDPTSFKLLETRKNVKLCVSEKLPEQNCRLFFCKLEPDAGFLDVVNSAKRWLMIFDALLLEGDRLTNYIVVADFEHLHYHHFLKIIPIVKPGLEIMLNAFTDRIAALHYLHTSFLSSKATAIIKLYSPKKIGDRIFTHATHDGFTGLIDERLLCTDLGGKGSSTHELEEYTQQILAKHKQWFEDQNDICSNEPVRRWDGNQSEKIQGSFRMLGFD